MYNTSATFVVELLRHPVDLATETEIACNHFLHINYSYSFTLNFSFSKFVSSQIPK